MLFQGLGSNEQTSEELALREKVDVLEKMVLELRNEIKTIHLDRKATMVGLEENTIKRTVKNKGI